MLPARAAATSALLCSRANRSPKLPRCEGDSQKGPLAGCWPGKESRDPSEMGGRTRRGSGSEHRFLETGCVFPERFPGPVATQGKHCGKEHRRNDAPRSSEPRRAEPGGVSDETPCIRRGCAAVFGCRGSFRRAQGWRTPPGVPDLPGASGGGVYPAPIRRDADPRRSVRMPRCLPEPWHRQGDSGLENREPAQGMKAWRRGRWNIELAPAGNW